MIRSFVCALRGILDCVRTERNMRIHLTAALYVLAAGVITGITRWEWAAAVLCVVLVMGMELVNTALERICDTLHPDRAEGIRLAKDCAAGGVLLCAAGAAVAGGLIFFRQERISRALSFVREQPALFALLLFGIPLCTYLMGRRKKK